MVDPGSVTRRAVILGAGATILAACSDPVHEVAPYSRGDAGATAQPPRTPSVTHWRQLERAVRGRLERPGSAGYQQAKLVENPRYDDNRPLAVLTVADPTDLTTALGFVADHGIPVAVRSGGHSYPGWSAGGAPGTGMPAALVLDCRALDEVDLDGDTARIGSGAALATVYDRLGRAGRAIPAGSCATVAVGGLTLGGGVGVLTRALGLTCDALTALEIVTADGNVRTVDADQDPDLFWALRGGGGGQVGVVTSFTFDTSVAPTLGTFFMTWPLARAPEVLQAWQRWAPDADTRLWSTLKALGGRRHPSGPILVLSGTWVGPAGALEDQLGGLLRDVPPPVSKSTSLRDYRTAMAGYAGCAGVPVDRCHTGPGGALTREAFAATSHVGYRPLDPPGITALVDHVEDAQQSDLDEAGVSLDALGGRVRDLGAHDTAFVHRDALMTVQYTATYNGDQASTATRFVRGLRAALSPSWGQHAYVNYADSSITDYRAAYFGGNAARLSQVKRTYDPHDVFAQPQSW